MNKDARRLGIRRPMPLRSAKFPLGLPGLRGLARTKVDQANALYVFSAEVATVCSKKTSPWSIENPLNAYFWDANFVSKLLQLPGVFDVNYDACLLGDVSAVGFFVALHADLLNDKMGSEEDHTPWKNAAGWASGANLDRRTRSGRHVRT